MAGWTLEQSKNLYNIAEWSDGYFDIDENGELAFIGQQSVSLKKVIQACQAQGLSLPILLRFNHILQQRVKTLQGAFADAIVKSSYQGNYQMAYPIKVNQQRQVVEQLLAKGNEPVGLEAGSKPELLAVLSMSHSKDALIICNGYKDAEYIRTALIARKLNKRIYIIVEKPHELDLIQQQAKDLGVKPLLGVRVRLDSIGAGKWQNSGGAKSKFGLTASQVLFMVESLAQQDNLSWLQLLHFHMGSQIANIHDIQKGLREAASYFVQLHKLGVKINVLDVGGGLGVDYDGTHSRNSCSMNYSITEYAENIVQTIKDICKEKSLPHPDIITECGRAMTAHHAVLITNIVDIERVDDNVKIDTILDSEPLPLQELQRVYSGVQPRTAVSAYHDAYHFLTEAQSLFSLGALSLEQRAKAENLYVMTCHMVRKYLDINQRGHREILDDLNEKLADKLFCNFSLFQSMPDIWAIQQVFPVMPLSGFDQKPSHRGIIQDTTCDSDGCIEQYVDGYGIEKTLPYYGQSNELLGFFLVGAYQEILGDMHNLFGDTDSVHVEVDEQGEINLIHPLKGDSVEAVLNYVHFDREALEESFKILFQQSDIAPHQQEEYYQELVQGLDGYTYLE